MPSMTTSPSTPTKKSRGPYRKSIPSFESRSCVICSKEFRTRRSSRQKTCSLACGYVCRANSERGHKKPDKVKLSCIVCGENFFRTPCLADQRTCGRVCGGVLRRKTKRIVNCKQCGKEFVFKEGGPTIYCGRDCLYAYNTGPNNCHWRSDRTKTCEWCGKEFDVPVGHSWKRNSRFCSQACGRLGKVDPKKLPIGSIVCRDGEYLFIKMSDGKWLEQHRAVVENVLGRKLKKSEIVHHRNGNKQDNRPENLVAMTRSQHMKVHIEAEKIGLSVMAANDWNPSIEGMAC